MRSGSFIKSINMAMFNASPFYFLRSVSYILLILIAYCQFTFISTAGAETASGVIGSDDRKIVSGKGFPWSAVGQVNISGYRNRISCTGTLIAPDKVLTAAHCLVNSRTGKTLPVHNMHFLAGVHRGKYLAHSKVKCAYFPDYMKSLLLKEKRRSLLEKDFAILVLQNKMKVPPLSLLAELKPDSPLVHPSYPRDRRHILSAHFNCRVLKTYKGIWTTNCDTNHGSSGGPVLAKTDNNYKIAGVMVAVNKGRFSLMIPSGIILRTIDNAVCK